MQRLNRSTHAPVGTAVFLFIGLAVLPFSLRATGFQISFSPRLSAAMDAWQQVADVFGAGYHAGPELSVVRELDTDPSTPMESPDVASRSDFACAGKSKDAPVTELAAPDAISLGATSVRRTPSKSASRRSLSSSQVTAVLVAQEIRANFKKHVPMLGELGALRVSTMNRDGLIKNLDKRLFEFSFEPIVDVQTPQLKNIRVLVRPRAVAGLSTRTAERKVFSAMASARRRECDRAILTGMTTASPDHSEF